MTETNWKQKLAALLHDPPNKPLKIQGHEDATPSLLATTGLSQIDREGMMNFLSQQKHYDHSAASADRSIFLKKQKALYVDWKDSNYAFTHPFCASQLKADSFPCTSEYAEEKLNKALQRCKLDLLDDEQRFIAVWRAWSHLAGQDQHTHFPYLVAETRIPDHTLWHHNALASAFERCGENPAFLIMQVGPVQDFIAQSRKLRDLWAGSYLLSYLVAQGMLKIADLIGPDCILSPSLKGVPLADWHWYKRTKDRENFPSCLDASALCTPSLPNRFMALVPAEDAKIIAEHARQAIQNAWNEIAQSVHDAIDEKVGADCAGWDTQWHSQVSAFPVIDHSILAWNEHSPESLVNDLKNGIPPVADSWEKHPLHAIQNYNPEAPQKMSFWWSLLYARASWEFDGVKKARSFDRWNGAGILKDPLTGLHEVMGGENHELFWQRMRESFDEKYFRSAQNLGALSLIKRLYPDVYLKPQFIDSEVMTQERFEKETKSSPVDAFVPPAENEDDKQGYYAILMMDGDNMGQWLSGEKALSFKEVLAKKIRSDDDFKDIVDLQRPLTPYYQASISEALGNFSLYCAEPIVKKFEGELIYSGGDDVMALLPVKNIIDCVYALSAAFRGEKPDPQKMPENACRKLEELFVYDERHTDGFIKLKEPKKYQPMYPLMVMGNKATCSFGVAIGHSHSPMQDIIAQARLAEKEAKKVENKHGFCLSIVKRSGEALRFSASLTQNPLLVWTDMAFNQDERSRGFAYHYVQLITPLLTTGRDGDYKYEEKWKNEHTETEELRELVQLELVHVLQRQAGLAKDIAQDKAKCWCEQLTSLPPRDFLHFWMGWAFVERQILKSEKE